MSRHTIFNGNREVIVGYDPTEGKYYFQVWDHKPNSSDSKLVAHDFDCTIEDCVHAAAFYGDMSLPQLAQQLTEDALADPPPSEVERDVHELMNHLVVSEQEEGDEQL